MLGEILMGIIIAALGISVIGLGVVLLCMAWALATGEI